MTRAQKLSKHTSYSVQYFLFGRYNGDLNNKHLKADSMFMLFYLDPMQNDMFAMTRFVHFIFCRGRELKLTDESVLPTCDCQRWKVGGEKEHRL